MSGRWSNTVVIDCPGDRSPSGHVRPVAVVEGHRLGHEVGVRPRTPGAPARAAATGSRSSIDVSHTDADAASNDPSASAPRRIHDPAGSSTVSRTPVRLVERRSPSGVEQPRLERGRIGVGRSPQQPHDLLHRPPTLPVNVALPGPSVLKDSTPIAGVLGAEHLDEELLLERQPVGQPAAEAVVDGPLGEGVGGHRRLAASSAAHASAAVEHVAVDDAVDEADAQRLLGADLAAREDQVLRPRRPDEAGQPLRAAAAGDDAEQHLGLAEPGRRAAHAQVAGQRQLAAAAEGEAGDRGDRGPRDGGDGVEGAAEGAADDAGLVGPAELGDVGARREHPVRPGDDDGAGRVGGRAPRRRPRSSPSSAVDSALTLPLSRRTTATPSSRRSTCTRSLTGPPAGRRWRSRGRRRGASTAAQAASNASPLLDAADAVEQAGDEDRPQLLGGAGRPAALETAAVGSSHARWRRTASTTSAAPSPVVPTVRTIGGSQPPSAGATSSSIPARSRSVSSTPGRSALLIDEHVGDLEQPRLGRLHAVAPAGVDDDDGRVGLPRHLDLDLADADGLEQHPRVAGGVEGPHRLGRRQRQPAEVATRRHRADEHAVVEHVVLHADPVAEDGAAGERRRRVDGEHGDAVAAGAELGDEPARQRRLARRRVRR